MAYKYESENISKIMRYNNLTDDSNIIGSYGELREVYKKAHAFDEIREIEIQSDITGYYDDTESYMYEVESVIEKYEEDE